MPKNLGPKALTSIALSLGQPCTQPDLTHDVRLITTDGTSAPYVYWGQLTPLFHLISNNNRMISYIHPTLNCMLNPRKRKPILTLVSFISKKNYLSSLLNI